MGDEAEMYDGVRAQFPLSFGKQTKSQTPLEQIHKSTLRAPPASSESEAKVSSASKKQKTDNPFASLSSSSSKSWLQSVKNPSSRDGVVIGPQRPSDKHSEDEEGDAIGPPRPRMGMIAEEDEDEDVMVGPPRPPMGMIAEEDEDEDVMIGPPRPPASGEAEEEEDDGPAIGPPRPPPGPVEDSDDEMDEEDEDDQYRIPLSNEIVLAGHTKVVTALAVDNSGSRVLSGSYDNSVRMYDFQGMNAQLKSFRQFEPFEGHPVLSLSWSPTSDRFLCVTGSAQAKIYDKDGLTLGEFVKGDMYIHNLKSTKGHLTGLTCGEWNPKEKEKILTSSKDGSLRIWDVNVLTSQTQVIAPIIQGKHGRNIVTACAWDREGKRIVGGIENGYIQIWSVKPGWGSRPDINIGQGHSDEITGFKFSSDGRILLSRSSDCSLKVWDLRQFKEPLRTFDNLPNNYGQTNVAFSPDEQLFLTGTSVERDSTTGGLLCFFDRAKLEIVSKVGISPTSSVVRCAWHPRLNQIFATAGGDKSHGETHVLYDPTISERGALVCVARAPRKKSVDDFQIEPVIHNPHALPMFRDQPSRKRQREKMLKDPLKSHRPELPMDGPGHGGRVGKTKGSLLTQYLMKQDGMLNDDWMNEDPRESILKYAEVAKNDPKYIAPAYAQTQPETILKSDSDDEEK